IARDDHADAKAGNLNHALSRTSGELFAIFDADFVPFRDFLRRTVGFFVFNDDIGIVQTPQHFYNQDVVQSNLYLEGLWPDEQRLFFDAMASSRDGWDAAFCCGACSIIRRKAVEEAGGIPTSSITEDLLSTLSLLTVGYRTVFLNERLAHGMSADSIKGYFVQRARWCRGGIQCLFLPEGPLRAESLSLLQRILFAPTGWIIQPLTRLFIVLVPLVFLWLGLAPLQYATAGDLVAYLVPVLVMYMLGIQWLAPRKYLPVVSTAVGLFGAFRLFPVAVSSLISPFGKPFLVTPKGSGATHGVDWLTLTISLVLLLGTLAGVAINAVPEYRIVSNPELLPAAIVWAAINTVMLFLCVLLSIDSPRRRKEERFLVHEPAALAGCEVILEDMSLGGCRLRYPAGSDAARPGQILPLKIGDVRPEAAVEVLSNHQGRLTCRFVGQTEELREAMIAKLFTGAYESAALGVRSVGGVLQQLFKRAFGEQRG
ncbi:MAG: glycosyltransferase family 2 protein, partial [Thiohalocapsa sp.]